MNANDVVYAFFFNPHSEAVNIVENFHGVWLIQIKDAGHAVTAQYPDKINKILQTFLSTTTNSG
jgi:pimeloyl-ACP methyl ester carboxylesterase